MCSGGFAYGDYLSLWSYRRFSPVMKAVISDRAQANSCSYMQRLPNLCEAGLLPGALVRNRSLSSCATCYRTSGMDDSRSLRCQRTLLRLP